jgi:hypothetical protein
MSERQVTILNGSTGVDDRTDEVAEVLDAQFAGRGWRVIRRRTADLRIAPCLGCFGCWVRTPGICVINDDAREIARDVVQSDVVVYATPVVFGGYSPQLKAALDRMISIIMPYFTRIRGEVHHAKRYRRYPRVLAVGLLPRPDPESEEIFSTLVHRSSLNMHAPKTAVRVLDRPSVDVEAVLEAAIAEVTR